MVKLDRALVVSEPVKRIAYVRVVDLSTLILNDFTVNLNSAEVRVLYRVGILFLNNDREVVRPSLHLGRIGPQDHRLGGVFVHQKWRVLVLLPVHLAHIYLWHVVALRVDQPWHTVGKHITVIEGEGRLDVAYWGRVCVGKHFDVKIQF
jgi:hypothetical protein